MSLGSSNYASRTKDLLGLVNQLRAVGAQSDVDLPRIVVIGNQSAGKSSVVEAISGITVPRDAGTCTRVPMEIRLSSSDTPWQCRISIRREYGKSQRLDTIEETPFGETIKDKSRVEEMLKRAQVAVLNPVIPHSKVLSASLQEVVDWGDQSVKTTPFSRNVVCVDLEGPDLTDLSFIDLPGIVANADNEIVQLVEDIVTDHIRGNCIILVALPMTDDVENQKALKLARTYDAQGNRTIGVLTKPDMLSGGATKSLSLWLDVIEGRRHPLSHGYFCTKQPDDRDRSENVTSAQARKKEKEFFRSTSPWKTSVRPDHFGTEHLVNKLSTLLVSVIDETLPKIRQDASDALAACRKDLSRIPDQLDEDPATHMLKLITDFAGEISSIVKGRSDASDLIQKNRAAYRQYKIAIRATAPNFIPSLKGEHQAVSILTLDGEDDDISLVQTPGDKFDLSDMKHHISKSITRELPGNVPFDAKTALIFKFQDTWKASTLECFEKVQSHTVNILYDYIDNEFSRFYLLNGHMKTFLNELCTKHAADCLRLLEQILETEMSPFTQNTHYLEDCTDKWLAKYKDARAGKKSLNDGPPAKKLKEDNNGNSSPFMFFGANGNNHGGNASGTGSAKSPIFIDEPPAKSTFQFQAPASGPSTGGASNTVKPSLTGYKAASAPQQQQASVPQTSPAAPARESSEDLTQEAIVALAKLGYHVTEEDLGKLNPPDEYETEMRVMAEVRSYFQIAYKRVIDNIPQLIDVHFLRKVARSLQPFLIEKFGLGTMEASERCGKYLTEDVSVVAKRDELLGRQKRLKTVQAQLIAFGLAEDF